MQLSRLPPALLLGLGLTAALSCRTRPCLSVLPPDVGPCLSVAEPDEPPDIGADEAAGEEGGEEDGESGEDGVGDSGDESVEEDQPDDEAPELADVSIERVLQSGALPNDVVARLRQRQ